MQKLTELVHDLSDKYNLQDETVKDCLKRAIERVLGNARRTVEVFLEDEDEISIYVYGRNITDPVRKMNFDRLSAKTIRAIKRKLTNELVMQKIVSEYQNIKHIIGNLTGGYIYDVKTNPISVMIDGIPDKLGLYPLMYQPKHERGRYRRGDYYYFHISSVKTVMVNKNIPKISIILSRTSKKLPELIIQKLMAEEGIDMFRVTCVKRHAGLYSIIKTSSRIPEKVLKYTSEKIGGERIYVQNV